MPMYYKIFRIVSTATTSAAHGHEATSAPLQAPTAAASATPGAAVSTARPTGLADILESYQLPVRFKRAPISEEECSYINVSTVRNAPVTWSRQTITKAQALFPSLFVSREVVRNDVLVIRSSPEAVLPTEVGSPVVGS